FTSYLSWMMPTSENTRLKLLVLSSFQNDNYEITGGADMVYSLSRTMVDTEAVGLGLYFRSNDAIILSPYYQYNSFTAGLSYDINISGLSAATKTYGALELWLSYGFNISGYRKQIKSIPCPTF
ncbi:MAG TPA: type IX secretion system membrane protein PorP/SprF, partial [Candidatus Onthomorpha intestinigallinarum]|nr:type IX secretion system membrane protein PorP/SprF [Candidatus Onthomorpha intestinigallinarum]